MKNLLIPAVLVLCFSIPAFSQITETEDKLRNQNQDTIYGWKTGGMISINLSQTSLTNWAAGGMNSLSINSLLTCFANYKSKNSDGAFYINSNY